MRGARLALACATALALSVVVGTGTAPGVTFDSLTIPPVELAGLLYRPDGPGPVPGDIATRFYAPLLILIGGRDDWTPAVS